MSDKKKPQSKLPKWLKNTFEVVGSLTVVMAAYNLIGPIVYPKGRYFEWWTFPFSIVLALIFVGLWSFHEERQAKKDAAEKLKAAKIEAERLKRSQELQQQAAKKAETRRQRNQQGQKHQ